MSQLLHVPTPHPPPHPNHFVQAHVSQLLHITTTTLLHPSPTLARCVTRTPQPHGQDMSTTHPTRRHPFYFNTLHPSTSSKMQKLLNSPTSLTLPPAKTSTPHRDVGEKKGARTHNLWTTPCPRFMSKASLAAEEPKLVRIASDTPVPDPPETPEAPHRSPPRRERRAHPRRRTRQRRAGTEHWACCR